MKNFAFLNRRKKEILQQNNTHACGSKAENIAFTDKQISIRSRCV
jgi:hypothetical protein